jgi:molecular chaperone IbpA
MRTYDFSPIFRNSVGFDRIQRLMDSASTHREVSYPPYNIENDGEYAYRITVAVAGFSENDLNVAIENERLTLSGQKENSGTGTRYLHKGIADRSFDLRFHSADHIKVQKANLMNGELVIDLEREVPEALKPRNIKINTHPVKLLQQRRRN